MKKFYFLLMLLGLSTLGWGQYAGTGTFVEITTLEEIESGSYYVFYGVNASYNGAMKNTVSGGRMGNSAVTINGSNEIVDPNSTDVWRIDGDGTNGYNVFNENVSKYCEIRTNSTSGYSLQTTAGHTYTVSLNGAKGYFFKSNHSSAVNRGISIYETDWRPYVAASTFTLRLFKYTPSSGPDDPEDFLATAASSTQIDLSATANASSNNIVVAYNTTNSFGTPSGTYSVGNAITGGGTVLHVGTAASLTNHISLSPNTTYYYKAWSVDGSTVYSTGVTANATTNNLTAPTASIGTSISSTGFTANWDVVEGASDYKLDVSPSSQFNITNVSENFSGFTTNNGTTDRSSYLDNYLQTTGWTGAAIYEMVGYAKMGSSSSRGTITTKTLDLSANSGNATLTFDLSLYGSDDTLVQVFHASDGTNFIQAGSDITPPATFTTQTISISGGTINSKIRIAAKNASSSRFYLDNIIVMQSLNLTGYNNLTVSGSSQVVTNLTPNTPYYYRVRAVGANSTSENSNVISVTTSGPATWTGTAWSNVTGPTTTIDAVIDGNFTTSTDLPFTAQSLTINAGKTLTISPTHTITVQNAITNNGTITIEHQGSLVQTHIGVDANSGSGTFKVHKTTRAYKEYDYNYWSSPVIGETVADAFNANSSVAVLDGATASGTGTNVNYIFHYNPANFNDTDNNGWDDNANDWIYSTGVMEFGKGYIALGAGSDLPFSTDFDAGTFTQSIFFEGNKVNNGTLTTPLLVDADASTSVSENLIGNPYPSAIALDLLRNDVANLVSEDPMISTTVRFWSHDTAIAAGGGDTYAFNYSNDDFATYNIATNTGVAAHAGSLVPTNYVASGQGIIVELVGTSNQNLTFNNTMRPAGNNTNFFRLANSPADNLWLNLTATDGLFRQIAVTFVEGASDTYDDFDSLSMLVANEANLYSLPNGTNKNLVIQGLSAFEDIKTVPLGLTTTYEGTYQISLDHTEGIFTQGQKIYLEDTFEEVIHDLNEGAYSFTQTAGMQINNRFILRFTNTALGNEETAFNQVKVYPNPSTGVFNIAYYGSETLQYTIYDLTGKTVMSGTGNTINLSQQAIGLYVAKITDGTAVRTLKLMRE